MKTKIYAVALLLGALAFTASAQIPSKIAFSVTDDNVANATEIVFTQGGALVTNALTSYTTNVIGAYTVIQRVPTVGYVSTANQITNILLRGTSQNTVEPAASWSSSFVTSLWTNSVRIGIEWNARSTNATITTTTNAFVASTFTFGVTNTAAMSLTNVAIVVREDDTGASYVAYRSITNEQESPITLTIRGDGIKQFTLSGSNALPKTFVYRATSNLVFAVNTNGGFYGISSATADGRVIP